MTGGGLGLDPQLLGVHPETFEALCLNPPGLPLVQIFQGTTSPQVERLLGNVRRPRRVARGLRLSRSFQSPLKQPEIELVVTQREPIAERT